MSSRADSVRVSPPAAARIALALGIFVGLDLLLVSAYVAWAAHSLPAPVPAAAHAAGVVFFSDFGPHEGLSNVSMSHVEHAARLFASGKVGRLVCVGGLRAHRPQPGAALMAAALARRGVPAPDLQHDTTSFDTIGNWHSAQAMLSRADAEDPLLISSPLHLLRIRHVTGGVGTPAPTTTIAQALRDRGSEIWLDVHREWLAWTATALLPADLYRRWVGHWRNFWDAPPPADRPPDDPAA
jgi:uncharacterized SAM-binding protein YcdF (DUF218 family)